MLIKALNSFILAHAPAHEARAVAPGTFSDLAAHAGEVLPVWEGASDQTIFGDPKINHAFRAWHDTTHKVHGFGFTLAGEIATCQAQCAEILSTLGGNAAPLAAVITAEVIGQAEYFAREGMFPVDQIGFTHAYLEGMRL